MSYFSDTLDFSIFCHFTLTYVAEIFELFGSLFCNTKIEASSSIFHSHLVVGFIITETIFEAFAITMRIFAAIPTTTRWNRSCGRLFPSSLISYKPYCVYWPFEIKKCQFFVPVFFSAKLKLFVITIRIDIINSTLDAGTCTVNISFKTSFLDFLGKDDELRND